jgi:hypothetical protein
MAGLTMCRFIPAAPSVVGTSWITIRRGSDESGKLSGAAKADGCYDRPIAKPGGDGE